jgi:hypothetical protein
MEDGITLGERIVGHRQSLRVDAICHQFLQVPSEPTCATTLFVFIKFKLKNLSNSAAGSMSSDSWTPRMSHIRRKLKRDGR